MTMLIEGARRILGRGRGNKTSEAPILQPTPIEFATTLISARLEKLQNMD